MPLLGNGRWSCKGRGADLTRKWRNGNRFRVRRRGRVAEGGGLLNRYRV
jgi:hypothetical protein